jgi:hypothetical protein
MKFCSIALIILFAAAACSPTIRNIGTWVNREKVAAIKPVQHTIFIVVFSQYIDSRFILENDLAKAAESKGLKAIKSLDVFGNILTVDNMPTKDVLVQKIRNLGCDGIFTVALTDQESETKYVPSSGSMYTPYPSYGYFGSYYGYSSVYYTPGYYTTDKTYFLQSNLYDVASEELLISMQSKAVNPKEIEKASKEYTDALIDELQKQGFLKGKK